MGASRTTKPNQLDAVKEALRAAGVLGKIGDGKIWSMPLDTVTRVRTGEKGDEAR